MDEDLIWEARWFIYDHFAKTARPPSVDVVAAHQRLEMPAADEVLTGLHLCHALFLDAETHAIRMAWPFSGAPTPFQVHANGLTYWANCAWDSLGIPAALHSDADIDAFDAWSNERIKLAIRSGQPIHAGERIHFLAPFTHWYDDIVFT